jgi:hypothetical protein
MPCADSSTICPPPGHHRPSTSPDDPQQPLAFVITDLTNP